MTVGPFGIGAQVKGIIEPVGRHFPALGDPRHRMEINGILGHQTFEEGGSDIDLGDRGGEVGIEIADVAANATVKDLVAVALVDGCFPWHAAGEANRRTSGQEPAEPAGGVREPMADRKPFDAGGGWGAALRLICRRTQIHAFTIRATAWAAMARPAPRLPMPSWVVAFNPMLATGTCVVFASAAFISASRGWIRGFSAITVMSKFEIAKLRRESSPHTRPSRT